MPSIQDLDARILSGLSGAGLTEEALISGVTVPGYFQRGYVEMDTGDRLVEGEEITFDLREEDLPALQINDPVTVSRQGQVIGVFRLAGMRPPDGSGRRLLFLGPPV